MKIKLKIIWCKICEKFWGCIADISWKLANLFKPKNKAQRKKENNIRKILRAIWEATKILVIANIFGVVVGAIVGLAVVGLTYLLGKTMTIIMLGLIVFIVFVIGVYKRDN